MSNSKDWFPDRQLEAEDIRYITELCGGSPLNEPNQLNNFFRYSAEPLMENNSFSILLTIASAACIDLVDINPAIGKKVFRNGALMYLGVLREKYPLTTIPCEPKIVTNIVNEDQNRFMWTMHERINDEAGSFCCLLQEAAKAIEADDPAALQLATVGAGLAHVVTLDSLRFQEEAAQLDAEHPEFAEIDTIFNRVLKES